MKIIKKYIIADVILASLSQLKLYAGHETRPQVYAITFAMVLIGLPLMFLLLYWAIYGIYTIVFFGKKMWSYFFGNN